MPDQKMLNENERQAVQQRTGRRGFLRTAGGVAAGTALFMAGCDGDSIPENRRPVIDTFEVANIDDDAMTVTFNVSIDDPDIDGRTEFDDSVTGTLFCGNGQTQQVGRGDSSPTCSYNEAGQYTARLRVEDNFGGTLEQATEQFMVGMDEPPPPEGVTLDFSSNIGVLNYAYALEQLEAAYYAQVVSALEDGTLSFSGVARGRAGASSFAHPSYLRDLAAHEAVHRDALGALIRDAGGDSALIPALEVDFSGIDFSDAFQVLGIAQMLEDTGVSAYNGAATYIADNDTYLTLAGKIVSVEARHASAIRALVGPETNSIDLTGLTDFGANTDFSLGVAQPPGAVVDAVNNLSVGGTDIVVTDITATNT